MKARIKATGEIVEVYFYGKEGYDYVCNDKEECYERGELEILDEPDYWTRLEHQYAGMAMQGLMSCIKQKLQQWVAHIVMKLSVFQPVLPTLSWRSTKRRNRYEQKDKRDSLCQI